MADWKVETLIPGTASEADVAGAMALHSVGFDDVPSQTLQRTRDQFCKMWVRGTRTDETGVPIDWPKLFLVREGERWLAKAETFGRTISTSIGPMTVMGLAHVVSHPEVRGQGMGKAVTQAVFQRIDRGEFAVAYFQTGAARGFYEKLGCRVVDNPLSGVEHPRHPGSNPLWEPYAMIYPADFDWPEGRIDLQGPAW